MRNMNYEQKTVEDVIEHVQSAESVLRTHAIDPTNRMSLANAAAATSNTPDELLAVMEYKLRHQAQKS